MASFVSCVRSNRSIASSRPQKPSCIRSEWATPRLEELSTVFGRTAVSDLAWARLRDWQLLLAHCWPEIAEQEIRIRGPQVEASLLRGWLRSRLGRAIRAVEKAEVLSVRLGGEELDAPSGEPRSPSDLLSAELDRLVRDRVYEEAVAAALTDR